MFPSPSIFNPFVPITPTETGVYRLVVLASPSSPKLLYPQHLKEPLLSSAQLCIEPALTSTAVEIPETVTGTLLSEALLFPSRPEPAEPKHFTSPVDALTKQV